RRISSARASRMAWPSVISRECIPSCWPRVVVSGIDILAHLAGIWIGSAQRKLLARLNFGAHLTLDARKCLFVGQPLVSQPVRQRLQRIALRLPVLLLLG